MHDFYIIFRYTIWEKNSQESITLPTMSSMRFSGLLYTYFFCLLNCVYLIHFLQKVQFCFTIGLFEQYIFFIFRLNRFCKIICNFKFSSFIFVRYYISLSMVPTLCETIIKYVTDYERSRFPARIWKTVSWQYITIQYNLDCNSMQCNAMQYNLLLWSIIDISIYHT